MAVRPSSSPPPRLAFVSAATPSAREAKARLEKRYGKVTTADADIVVALGGDGLMLQALHHNMRRLKPIYGMNLGTVGFLLNTFRETGLLERLRKARQVTLNPLRMIAVDTRGKAFGRQSRQSETVLPTDIVEREIDILQDQRRSTAQFVLPHQRGATNTDTPLVEDPGGDVPAAPVT